MITKLGAPGDTLVRATGSTPLVSAHAVKRAGGDLSVMLINKDPANDATITLSYSGFTPSTATPTVYSYLKNATSIGSTTAGSATRQTVPAYSTVVVQLQPRPLNRRRPDSRTPRLSADASTAWPNQ
jgi:hypothetical protein